MNDQQPLRIGSLFSGYGGLDLAFEQAGIGEPAWFVEWEPYVQYVLRQHYPRTPIYGDITTIDFTKLERVDVLTGGFPCTDVSVAGKQEGIRVGTRSGLWFEFARAISEIRPRYVIIENVSALLGNGLDTVLCDLAALGYDAVWSCVPASGVGAPHRRDRVFVVAYADGERRYDWEHLERVGRLLRDGSGSFEEGEPERNRRQRRSGEVRAVLPDTNSADVQGLWRTE